ncbi:DUF7146 domain-containing protein [Methylobacter sp. YRD-M1]|uniref:DUF7146 domain-containing protein n=1 Tax=Methylobacter sp. YRD-M1 TaxID=2911520 RepID=UPI00227AEE48|nr:toprim domain-containing protein [Methylobacter sp. YRD-M1]WAK04400.1 toprim domain-containing protein [Methylobacter sp. YRD-M1]
MSTKPIESNVVRNAARGVWLSVLDSLAPELEKAISKPGRHVGCPVHGGKDGFKLFRNADIYGGGICNTCGPYADGFSLLMWLRSWSFPEALSAVADVLGLSCDSYQKPILDRQPAMIAPSRSASDDEKIKRSLRTLWRESKSLHHPDAEPVRLYLESRGLDGWLSDWPTLRFHPRLQYRDEDNRIIGYFPAMLALVEKGDQAITIHRTFLTRDGRKAPVDSPKKMMSIPSDRSIMGAAVRLGRPGRVLNVTEGIETALAVIEATGMVTWPLISSTFMQGFEIPAGVEKLIIWNDLDRPHRKTGIQAGSEAASKLAERAIAEGVEPVIREPKGPLPTDAKSIDWLDVYNQDGPNVFAFRSVI